MAGTLQTLFQGQTPPAAPTYTGGSSQVPTWLLNSENSLVGQANAVAGQPYQSFPGPMVASWTNDQYAAQNEIEGMQGQYQPMLGAAGTLASMASNPAPFNYGMSFLPGATSAINSAMAPTSAQMNPYINNVIQNAETQANQYWQNQLSPQINNQFTAAGQYGSSANQRAAGLTGSQLAANIEAQANAALAGGYQNAQQVGLAGGQALGTLGQLAGGLGYEGGILGLQGAGQLGTLAQMGNSMGLQNAGTLYNMGQAQQQQGQSNLNAAYQNWYNQTYYPQSQLSWLQGTMTGAPQNTGTATTGATSGYLPGSTYGASPLSQSLGIYTGLNALSNGQNPNYGGGYGGYSPYAGAPSPNMNYSAGASYTPGGPLPVQ